MASTSTSNTLDKVTLKVFWTTSIQPSNTIRSIYLQFFPKAKSIFEIEIPEFHEQLKGSLIAPIPLCRWTFEKTEISDGTLCVAKKKQLAEVAVEIARLTPHLLVPKATNALDRLMKDSAQEKPITLNFPEKIEPGKTYRIIFMPSNNPLGLTATLEKEDPLLEKQFDLLQEKLTGLMSNEFFNLINQFINNQIPFTSDIFNFEECIGAAVISIQKVIQALNAEKKVKIFQNSDQEQLFKSFIKEIDTETLKKIFALHVELILKKNETTLIVKKMIDQHAENFKNNCLEEAALV